MSARIAPEPISIGITYSRPAASGGKPSSRPVESASASSPGTADRNATQNKNAHDLPQPSSRPPGKDPSIPPQALLDASLISAEFKPEIKFEFEPELVAQPEAEDTDDYAHSSAAYQAQVSENDRRERDARAAKIAQEEFAAALRDIEASAGDYTV